MPVYSPRFLDGLGVGHINGSLWTIPVEVTFYAVIPVLVFVTSRFGVRRLLTLLFVLALGAGLTE